MVKKKAVGWPQILMLVCFEYMVVVHLKRGSRESKAVKRKMMLQTIELKTVTK